MEGFPTVSICKQDHIITMLLKDDLHFITVTSSSRFRWYCFHRWARYIYVIKVWVTMIIYCSCVVPENIHTPPPASPQNETKTSSAGPSSTGLGWAGLNWAQLFKAGLSLPGFNLNFQFSLIVKWWRYPVNPLGPKFWLWLSSNSLFKSVVKTLLNERNGNWVKF